MTSPENKAKKYVLETAQLLNLTIDPEYLPKVVENWLAITKIAFLVTEFDLPQDIESAAGLQPEPAVNNNN